MGLVIKTTQPPLLASLIINLQLLFNASKSFHLALVGFDLRDLKSFVVVLYLFDVLVVGFLQKCFHHLLCYLYSFN